MGYRVAAARGLIELTSFEQRDLAGRVRGTSLTLASLETYAGQSQPHGWDTMDLAADHLANMAPEGVKPSATSGPRSATVLSGTRRSKRRSRYRSTSTTRPSKLFARRSRYARLAPAEPIANRREDARWQTSSSRRPNRSLNIFAFTSNISVSSRGT